MTGFRRKSRLFVIILWLLVVVPVAEDEFSLSINSKCSSYVHDLILSFLAISKNHLCTKNSKLNFRPKWQCQLTYHPTRASVQSAVRCPWNKARFSPSSSRSGSWRIFPVTAKWSAQTWACCTSVSSQISGLAPCSARLSLCAFKQTFATKSKIAYSSNKTV